MPEAHVSEDRHLELLRKDRPWPPAPRHGPPDDLDVVSGEELLRSTGDCGVAAQPKPVERAENFQFHIAKARAVQPRPHGVEHTADVPHAWDADVEERLRHVRQREARGAATKVPATQPVEIDARAEEVAAVDLILGRIADRGGCCALHSRQDLLPGPPRKPAAYRVHLS